MGYVETMCDICKVEYALFFSFMNTDLCGGCRRKELEKDGKQARKAVKKAKGKGTKCPVMDKADPFKVWVNWEYTYISGGEICAGQEDDNWPSHETENKNHEVHGVYSEDAEDGRGCGRYNERIDVEFEPVSGAEVFLVVVTYSSGSTFGSSSGNVTVVGCYEEEAQADSIASDIRADDMDADRTYRRSGKRSILERFTGYKAWTGYFDGLEGVEVYRLRLDEPSAPVASASASEGVNRF